MTFQPVPGKVILSGTKQGSSYPGLPPPYSGTTRYTHKVQVLFKERYSRRPMRALARLSEEQDPASEAHEIRPCLHTPGLSVNSVTLSASGWLSWGHVGMLLTSCQRRSRLLWT